MAEGQRERGEILGLLDLIEEHPAAIRYDWRTRFHVSADGIGTDEFPWDEAVHLAEILRADPSSAIAAAMEGWDHPISREALILMDQFDLDVQVNSDPKKGRPQRYKRPFPIEDGRDRQRIGNAGGRSPAEVAAVLRGLGHNIPV